MKRPGLCAIVALSLAVSPSTLASLPQFTLSPIQTNLPDSYYWSWAYDINDQGWAAAGTAELMPGSPTFFIDKPGGSRVPVSVGPRELNNAGQIAGEGVGDAAAWDPVSGEENIGSALAGSQQSWAEGINDSGFVVGHVKYADRVEAFLREPGLAPATLGIVSPGTSTFAYGVNDTGVIAGAAQFPGESLHAATWSTNDGWRNLGDLVGGSGSSYSRAINNAGVVVGYSQSTTGPHACLWTSDGTPVDLGDLPGGTDSSEAFDINESGWVVGIGTKPDTSITGGRGIFWTAESGMVALEDLLTPEFAGWTILNASAINESGQIVGQAYSPEGYYRGVILSPVPSPTVSGVIAIASIMTVRRRRT